MYQSRASIVTYLAFTVLVGLGGTGFLMYYSTELQPEDSSVAITYQRPTPQVLGVEVEGSGLTTSEVFEVFGQYCIREPSDNELTDWMGGVRE